MNFLVGSFQLAVSEVNLELPIFISEGLLVISNLKLVKTANCQLPTCISEGFDIDYESDRIRTCGKTCGKPMNKALFQHNAC